MSEEFTQSSDDEVDRRVRLRQAARPAVGGRLRRRVLSDDTDEEEEEDDDDEEERKLPVRVRVVVHDGNVG